VIEPLAAPNPQATASNASASLSQLSEDYTRFLTLLTAQIANQDPLAPMDSSQFVTQLAQLSQVEQSVKVNGNLEGIKTKLDSFSTMAGAGMLGRTITVASDAVELVGGASQTSYRLAAPAQSVSATITDSNGDLVRTITGLSGDSQNVVDLNWDGLGDDGQLLSDGSYTIDLKPLAEDGSDITSVVFQDVNVTEVIFDFGQSYLSLSNGALVSLFDVLSVS
jgi:flagellar basal-body rod modification protein FlgD